MSQQIKTSNQVIYRFLPLLLTTLLVAACGTYNQPFLTQPQSNKSKDSLPEGEVVHRTYMIGDAGGFNDKEKKQNFVFNHVKERIANDSAEKSVVFLGDNIYNKGLGEKGSADYERERMILQAHLDVAEGNDSKMYFIPGNHDWNNNSPGGLAAIQRQEEYVKENRISKHRVKFYPKNGCGDPEVVKISKDLVYIIFDSQWWVHDWSTEKNINKGCEIKSRREFVDKMKDLIIEHKNDQIILFLHHPMISNGNHGGKFSFKDHLFPLTKKSDIAYLPLPFIGSIYPLYRQLGGTNQDNTYPLIKELHKELESTIRGYDAGQVMFVSGHDHFLQHTEEQFIFQKFPIHYIISGSGYKKGYAAKGFNANFVYSKRGYSVLSFYSDGSTWLDFYTISDDGKEEKLSYRKQIYEGKPGKKAFENISVSADRPETVTLAPNETFGKGGTYRFFLGDQFREAWTTPIKSPIFSPDKFYDGVTPIKKGGGLFSRTLRLEGEDGKQYVMRSMNKDFYKAVPEKWKGLELLKLYSDQNTASIPYGALYVSALSEYANVYHSDPKIVYLDEPKILGPFEEYFPKGHYLLEARPDGDWSDSPLFGSSKEVVGYNDLLYNLRKKTNHFVDQKWVLKSRLFDILIHDRDRHDDQWRWAAFEEGDKTIYRPVPRDRDWAFFKYGGLIPWVMGNIVDKKLKSFNANSIDVKSLATNANTFDRYFLNELTWSDWEEVIEELTSNISDEAIEKSLEALPPESIDYLRGELVDKLKSRKKILKRDVKKYYDFITKEIEVTGTDEKDIFEISMLDNGDTHVIVYKDSEKYGKVKKYDRVIEKDATEELRIYGLAGKDKFNINKVGKGHCRIRIIGGIGDDKLEINGFADGGKKIAVYDSPGGMEISGIQYVSDHRDEDLLTNEYDRRGFLYDTGLPWLNLGYAPDDGLILGVGFNSIKHGWRKSPYEASHLFNVEVTPNRGFGIDLEYEGEWVDVFGKGWGFAPEVFLESPDYINYFGLGSNSDIVGEESKFNWVQRSSWGVVANIIARRASNRIKFTFGPGYESHDLNPEEGSILLALEEFDLSDFDRTHFVGLQSELRIHTLDRVLKPSRGFLIEAFAKHQYNLNDKNHVLGLGGSIAFFIPLSVRYDITFGSNSGYQKMIGDPLFYQLPSMGSKKYLRPFRSHRYRGEAIAYQQFDLRFKFFDWNNTVVPMTIGGIGGYDFGQVYYKGQDNGDIKHGWTGGVYFDLLGYFILRTSFSGSTEGTYFVFDVGFNF